MQKLFELPAQIDSDGICRVGAHLRKYSPLLVLYDVAKRTFKTFYNKES